MRKPRSSAEVPGSGFDERSALRAVVEGTASETGQAFFDSLVHNLARALDVHGAWVTRWDELGQTLDTVSFWLGDALQPGFQLTVPGSPCEDETAGSARTCSTA